MRRSICACKRSEYELIRCTGGANDENEPRDPTSCPSVPAYPATDTAACRAEGVGNQSGVGGMKKGRGRKRVPYSALRYGRAVQILLCFGMAACIGCPNELNAASIRPLAFVLLVYIHIDHTCQEKQRARQDHRNRNAALALEVRVEPKGTGTSSDHADGGIHCVKGH
jgi:hypothetical protein